MIVTEVVEGVTFWAQNVDTGKLFVRLIYFQPFIVKRPFEGPVIILLVI